MEIKDLFKMNFAEEIEAVIKVGEYSEKSATEEINNYIVTDQIADRLESFIDYYDGTRKDTGIWVSGFYGSGKSYLAKVISYLLENPNLMGVKARDLFKDRLAGLDNKLLLENKIEGLSKYNTKTVMFDLSGENLTGSFYKKLLLNFLWSIGLPKNYIGYVEYQLMKTNKYEDFLMTADKISQEKTGKDWEESRSNKMYAPGIIKEAWLKIEAGSEKDITDTIDRMHNIIDSIDADSLVGELDAFLEMNNDYDRLVFIVDEVSEALDQEHIELSEIRGTAQHLSQDGQGKYWFIATAQEKLDNILSRKNISQNDINIITDRFQEKIHLSSQQVDKVTKERVLAKTDEGKKKLREFYEENNGAINELSNLNGNFSTSIDSVEEFVDYYPFFNYQMRLLKKFLFAVFQQAKAGGSERGMLVTVDRLLKNEDIFQEEIGKFVTAYQLCDYGFPMPPSELEEKFNKARTDLEEEGIEVEGDNLLKSLFFLERSEDLKTTIDNIVRAHNNKLTYIGDIKPEFEDALKTLEEKTYVLQENLEYKITSDVEERMMEEMNQITVGWEDRIDIIRDIVKDMPFITQFSTNHLDNKTYNVAIRDEKDNLLSDRKGEVELIVYNVLNVEDDIERVLEDKKNEFVELDRAAMIPEIENKNEIDKLATKIYKHKQMIKRNRNTTDEDKKKVIDSFQTITNSAETNLERLIEKSYHNSWLIYDFNEKKLDKDTMNNKIDDIQSEMIDKTFSKRLRDNLSQGVAEKFLTADNDKLAGYCTSGQFDFFDNDGTFIGENLRVIQEIDKECSDKDGRTGSGLIETFTQSPYGWEVEDIMGTMAALLRSGNLKVKYQGRDYRSYRAKDVRQVFTSSRDFKEAKFYTLLGTGLPASKKQRVVDNLLELDIKDKINVDYKDNDFQVVNSISTMASRYQSEFANLKEKIDEDIVEENRNDIGVLSDFANRRVGDRNLESEADEFLNNVDEFQSAITYIKDLARFEEHEYMDYKNRTNFIEDVKGQLEAVSEEEIKQEIEELIDEYKKIEDKGIVENVEELKRKYNDIRQKFNELFATYFEEFKAKNEKLLKAAKEKKVEIKKVDEKANSEFYNQLENYISTCQNLQGKEFSLSNREAKDRTTNSTLKEIIQGIELKGYNIQEVKDYIPIKDNGGNGNGNGDKEDKTYEIRLRRRTNNIDYIKRKLNQVQEELDSEEYDYVEIKIID